MLTTNIFNMKLIIRRIQYFKKGVYPTRADAERAIGAGAMFIYEENGLLCGSLILDKKQPVEYANILWKADCAEREVMVIHLLMVRPQMSGRGIGSALIKYAVEFARNDGCKALRLDTGGQNIPAVALYEKMNLILSCVPLKRLAMLLLMKIICF